MVASTASSSAGSTGLVTKSSTPASRQALRLVSSASAVAKMGDGLRARRGFDSGRPRRLHAVEPRHMKIHEHHVECSRGAGGDGRLSGRDLVDGVPRRRSNSRARSAFTGLSSATKMKSLPGGAAGATNTWSIDLAVHDGNQPLLKSILRTASSDSRLSRSRSRHAMARVGRPGRARQPLASRTLFVDRDTGGDRIVEVDQEAVVNAPASAAG